MNRKNNELTGDAFALKIVQVRTLNGEMQHILDNEHITSPFFKPFHISQLPLSSLISKDAMKC